MPVAPNLPAREVFVEWVHDALGHLYNSRFLDEHPLADALVGDVADMRQRTQSLRRILVDVVRALRPAPGTPSQSPDWRMHRILELRYIEGLTPAEVMERLALSKSHYFREQSRVVEAVAAVLWERALTQTILLPAAQPTMLPAAAELDTGELDTGDLPGGSRSELAQTEAERLCAHAIWEAVDIAELLADLRPVIESLAAANGVALAMPAPAAFPVAHASRTLLRQSLLNVVTYALDMAPGGALTLAPVTVGMETGFAVRATRPAAQVAPAKRRQGIGLEIARRLLAAMTGRLTWEEGPDAWEARLLWRTGAGQTLLVVDDNLGFIDLIRRYLTGYNWQVVGAGNGQEARQVLAEQHVSVIVLDVMMPEEDGWELLRALRATEATRDLTIIVCSVLNEPQLAQMLGASAYLPKPVSRQALLAALPVPDANPALTH